MLGEYFGHVEERQQQGVLPRPLTPEQTAEVCRLLEEPPAGKGGLLLQLIRERVAPGVDPAAKVKADWLGQIARKQNTSPVLEPQEAVFLLGTMLGGYNVDQLLSLLEDNELGPASAESLKLITLVYGAFDRVMEMSKTNALAAEVLSSWAEGEWFLSRPEMPEIMELMVFKVDGETNTDDFSPAKHAWSRPDIPLHALSMGETRFAGGIDTIRDLRVQGHKVAFVGDVVGTGSSRKSATNSLLWHIGEDIPFVPNKRREGVVLGGLIAPIFFNTVEDSGGLPVMCDVTRLRNGESVTLNIREGTISNPAGRREALPDHRTYSDPQGARGAGASGGGYFHPGGQPGNPAGPGLQPGTEDRGPGLRREGYPARLRLRAQDDDRGIPGHDRPHDRGRAQGTCLSGVPVRDVHAVVLSHRRLSQTSGCGHAWIVVPVCRGTERSGSPAGGWGHPLLA
jgi:aconitate hydratase 2/2-methylisocitrate dehydratase